MWHLTLPVVAIAFGAVSSGGDRDGRPQIGAASVWTDGPTLVYGANLDGDIQQYVQVPPKGPDWTDADLKASLERVLAGRAQPIPAPPGSAPWRRLESRDPYTLVAQAGRIAGPAVLFLKNARGVSAPWVLNAPEVWGLNPARVRPGEAVTVWGVNLGRHYGLVASDGQVAAILKGYAGYNDHSHRYELQFYNLFLVPADLPPGAYTVYNWSGLGDAGWSQGQALEVVSRPGAPRVFNVRAFGARGDGVADDTEPIRRAMAQAAGQGPAVVYLPSGRYAVTGTLTVPEGVRLQGESRDSTTILTSRYAPFVSPFPADALLAPPPEKRKSMTIKGRQYIARTGYPVDWLPELDEKSVLLRLQDRTGLEELTVEVTHERQVRIIVLVGGPAGAWCHDLVIDRCRFLAENSGLYGPWPDFHVASGIYVVSPVRYFRFTRNEFSTNAAAITFLPAPHWDGSISFNRISTADPHITYVAMGVGGERVLFQGNVFEDTGRGKTGGAVYWSPRPVWRNCYLHNIFRNLRKSDGEMLLYETGSCPAWGPVTDAGPSDLLAQPAQAWTADQWKEHRVLIAGGRGVGQVRWVTGNTADRLTVDRPWQVVPDRSSRFCLLRGEALENLHIGNEYFFCHQWSGVYGAAVRNVWVNTVMEMVGGGHYLWKIHEVRQQSLNVHLGNQYNERARLVIVNDRFEGLFKPLEVDLPMVFGNEARRCFFRRPSYVATENSPDGGASGIRGKIQVGTGCPLTPMPGEEPAIGLYDSLAHPSRSDPDDPALDKLPVSTRWNLLANNLFMQCPVGVRIGRRVEHTVLVDNTFYDCTRPVHDSGSGTVETGRAEWRAFQTATRPGKQE